MRILKTTWIFTLTAVLWQAAATAEELTGVAVKIFDGDSFIVKLTSGGNIEVRLGEIDAPEKNQPYADEARDELTYLIAGRKLRLDIWDKDRYGRKVARVFRTDDDLDINFTMVEEGHVWVYRQQLKDKTLLETERKARLHKRGLWALPDEERTPPWRWRQDHPRDNSNEQKPKEKTGEKPAKKRQEKPAAPPVPAPAQTH